MLSYTNTFTSLLKSMLIPLFFIFIIVLLELANQFLGFPTNLLGNRPRQIDGIVGILTMPFVHQGFFHVFDNSTAIFVIGTFLFYHYKKIAFKVLSLIWLMVGVGIWLFARSNTQIGASGIACGLTFFLSISSIVRRDAKLFVFTLLISPFFPDFNPGGIPGFQGISWEGYMIGAFSGVLLAFYFKSFDLVEDVEIKSSNEKPHHYWHDSV